MEYSLVYITFKDKSSAKNIGRILVQERLVACANIIPGIKSIYLNNNEVEESDEVVMMAKTSTSEVDKVITSVKELHTYDCPCIVAIPFNKGNGEYLKWIKNSVTSNILVE